MKRRKKARGELHKNAEQILEAAPYKTVGHLPPISQII